MAFIKCSGGGGKLKETELWKNPNIATGNVKSFSSQTINLNYSIDNFEYLKFNYRVSDDKDVIGNALMSVLDFNTAIDSNGHINVALAVRGGSVAYYRRITYTSSTSIHIWNSSSGSGSTNNTTCLPLYVYGLK